MSYVDISRLKGVQDPTLRANTRKFLFTTAQELHDSLQEFGGYYLNIRIKNNDIINSLTYRTDQPGAPLITVDPLSDETILLSWGSFIQVIPNAVTGSGSLEIDVVPIDQARLS